MLFIVWSQYLPQDLTGHVVDIQYLHSKFIKGHFTPANLHEIRLRTTEYPVVARKRFFGAIFPDTTNYTDSAYGFMVLKGEKVLKFSSKKNDLVPDAQQVRSEEYSVLISADVWVASSRLPRPGWRR